MKSTALQKIEGVIPKKDVSEIFAFKNQIETRIDSDVARQTLKGLLNDVDKNYLKAAGLLYKISREGWFFHWENKDGKKYESFAEWVEDDLGFGLRKAQYLMAIWHWFMVEVNSAEVLNKVAILGWGKVRALVGVVNKDNVDEWVQKGLENNLDKLTSLARMYLRGSGDGGIVGRMTFQLHEDQQEIVNEAIALASQKCKTTVKSQALSKIALYYVSSNLDKNDDMSNVKSYLKKIEKLYGLSLCVYDKDGNLLYKSKGFRYVE